MRVGRDVAARPLLHLRRGQRLQAVEARRSEIIREASLEFPAAALRRGRASHARGASVLPAAHSRSVGAKRLQDFEFCLFLRRWRLPAHWSPPFWTHCPTPLYP